MLRRAHRLSDGREFATTVRRGRKVGGPSLVTHVVTGTGGVTSVGFVVSKAVGPAVVRNRVKRRLRHLMRERLTLVPDGSRVVVRALPSAASASSDVLGDQLDDAFRRAVAQ